MSMGRRKADCWSEYKASGDEGAFKGKRVKCQHCGHELTAHANRMKDHLRTCDSYRHAIEKGDARQVDLTSLRYEPTTDYPDHFSIIRSLETPSSGTIRMGIVGGKPGSFIGPLHITAAQMDRRVKLVCGCFSSDPNRSKQAGLLYGLPKNRVYKTYEAMFQKEAMLPESERMTFVAITTPNDTHFPIAMAAIQHGFHVMCEKPLCMTEDESMELFTHSREKGVLFAMNYPYSNYPIVKYARDLVQSNVLGHLINVRVTYLQSSGMRTKDVNVWRCIPSRVGISYCFGDIGVHAYQLMRYITGLTPVRLSACLARTYTRELDDSGVAMLQMKEGTLVTITASKVSFGHENDLVIEVDGTAGNLRWDQNRPNELELCLQNMSKQIVTPNSPPLSDHLSIRKYCRLPGGHPEGFVEAMANVYEAFASDLELRSNNDLINMRIGSDMNQSRYPSIVDGVEGMAFVYRCVDSSQRGGSWIEMSHMGMDVQHSAFDTSVPSLPTVYDSIAVSVPHSSDQSMSSDKN